MNLESAMLAIQHGAAPEPMLEAFQANANEAIIEAFVDLMDYPSHSEVRLAITRLVETLAGREVKREAMTRLQAKHDEREERALRINEAKKAAQVPVLADDEPAFDPFGNDAEAAAVPQL